MIDDLYYPEKRERYYKQAHHIKVLLRSMQTADTIKDIAVLHRKISEAVDILADIKYSDKIEYKEHMDKMLTDIIERGCDGKET